MAAVAAATAVKKWVGFDMDECLAQLGILYYFLAAIPADAQKFVAERLAKKEKKGETWILRPALRELIPLLAAAPHTEVFIYSNNGSQPMVDFVGNLVNAIAEKELVRLRFSAEWPEKRKGTALSKNLEFLQKYMSADLTKENVLFFDDLPDHTLAEQLASVGINTNGKSVSNYIQVAPYKNQLDYEFLTHLFEGYISAFPDVYEKWKLLERAKKAEERDMDEGAILDPPDPRQVRAERILFRGIFQRFLELPTTTQGATRRAARKIARKTRKCRRRRLSHSPTP
jgi:hypothetical protein